MLAAFVLPPTDRTAAAAPTRTAAPPPAPGPRFAELLQQRSPATHGVLARPAETPPAAAQPVADAEQDADAAADDATPSQARVTAHSARQGAKAAPRSREKAPLSTPAEAPAPEAATTETAARPRGVDDGAATATAQPAADLRDWLAALNSKDSADTDAAEPTAEAGTRAARPGAPALAARDAPGAGQDVATASAAGSNAVAATETLPAAADRDSRAASAEVPQSRDAGPQQALPGAARAALPRGFDIGSPAPVALPAPLHAPDFAQLLGAQVSVLARDGVQQAELHLNPADMGPISVQIEIDGTQARVDFSAHAAETREVIERGLPELAAALREQGLTLAGGGVFQQPPDRRNPHDDSTTGAGERLRRGSQRVVANATVPGPIMRPVAIAQGRLDVYA